MTNQLQSLRDLLTHPLAAASYAFTAVAALLNVPFLDVIASVIWANAGTLFGGVSVVTTTLAPEIAWLPVEELRVAMVITGLLFVATRANRLWTAFKERYSETNS